MSAVRQAWRPRDAERLKFFTDDVVAIALTLLILPLMDAVSEASAKNLDTAELLNQHGNQAFSFLISFTVIAVFWTMHHRLYEHVRHFNDRLLWLNLLWMLTIVVMPVTTAMMGSMRPDSLQALLYVGTMFLSSLVLFVMVLVVWRTPILQRNDDPMRVDSLTATGLMAVLYLVALVIATAIPGIGYLSLFLLSLLPLVHRLVTPRVSGWLASSGAGGLPNAQHGE